MKYIVKPSSLKGEITIPSSKSHTLRAILFGSLGSGKTHIHHYLPSTDTQSMISACRLLGAKLEESPHVLSIQGFNGVPNLPPSLSTIDAGNSGIVLRFCAAIAALASHPLIVTGDHSIRHLRPITPLLSALQQLGAKATSLLENGYAPISVQGPMKPGTLTIEGQDSQPVSAMLIAAAFIQGETEIYVKDAGEKPWVGLTLDWFDRLGIRYEHRDFEYYRVFGHASYSGFDYTVPGDFSSGAFPIAAALITKSELTIHNLDMNDSQGDKELIFAFQKMGAEFTFDEHRKTLQVKKNSSLHGIKIDINRFVDAITILAVVGCFAEGETEIYNGAIAKQKECNRIQSIVKELKKMGANIVETEDGVIVKKSPLKGTTVYSYEDHRMAMSLAVAALGATGETTISSVACVAKTYPTFMRDFNLLGAYHGEPFIRQSL